MEISNKATLEREREGERERERESEQSSLAWYCKNALMPNISRRENNSEVISKKNFVARFGEPVEVTIVSHFVWSVSEQ